MDDAYSEILGGRLDASLKNKPYGSDDGYIRDIHVLVALCLIAASSYKDALGENAGEEDSPPMPGLPGTAMSIGEAIVHVGDFFGEPPEPNRDVVSLVEMVRGHIACRAAATSAAGASLRIEQVREKLSLSDFEFFCLCCALCCALDRGFERLFVALHGEEDLLFPTIGVIRSVYSLAFGVTEGADDLFNASSPANRLLFAPAPASGPEQLRPVALRPAALGFIIRKPYMSRGLAARTEIIGEGCPAPRLMHLDHQVGLLSTAVARMARRSEPRLCILCGPDGSGKKSTLRLIASGGAAKFLIVRLDGAATGADADELADEIAALALFEGYIPCFRFDSALPQLLPRVLKPLGRCGAGAVLLAGMLESNFVQEGWLVSRVDYPLPGLEQAISFWREFSAGMALDSGVDFAQLAAKYVLTAGQIREALRAANEDGENGPVTSRRIGAAVLLGNTGRLSGIADRIDVVYGWDDLVLGEAPKQMLRDVCNRIKYRHKVEIQWGFGARSAYGNGISILLYGPPGTGKTMGAQVIAGELDLPLYRINLAQIISKYIGETAKNLDTVFNEAKSSNVILFFDEADALFSKRTDVKNSNDRHANSESSYLLQKIEEYSGICILATNLANNFDEAFRRRINYMINIHMPSPAQRLELWRRAIPEGAPLAPDADLRLFADNLEFSGSVIKSAVLQAAFFAADENSSIGMRHIASAARHELQKLGKSEPHFLSMYPAAASEQKIPD